MTRRQFIEQLKKELLKHGISNINDILNEYENHFEEGKKVGKSEEEICNNLGNPKTLAIEYCDGLDSNQTKEKKVFLNRKIVLDKKKKIILIILATILLVAIATPICNWIIDITSNKEDLATANRANVLFDAEKVKLTNVSVDNNNTLSFKKVNGDYYRDKSKDNYLAIDLEENCTIKSIKIDGEEKKDSLVYAKDHSVLKQFTTGNLYFTFQDPTILYIQLPDQQYVNIVIEVN